MSTNGDMTERAYDALRRSEAKFRSLLESAPDAIVMVDAGGRIVLANAQTEALFGYGRRELIGESVELLIPERFRAAHTRQREQYALAPDRRAMGEGRSLFCRRKDGSEFPADIALGPVETEDGLWIRASIRDVTTRRRAEMMLELVRTAALAANAATDADTALRQGVDAICDFTGWPIGHVWRCHEEELLLEPTGLWHMSDPDRFSELQKATMACRFRADDKLPGYVLETMVPLWVESLDSVECPARADAIRTAGLHVGVAVPVLVGRSVPAVLEFFGEQPAQKDPRLIAVFEQIGTILGRVVERSRAEEQRIYAAELERSNQELQTFASVASHDLQEPLRMVTSFMQLLASRYGDQLDERAREYIGFAVEGATRMQKLVEGLLDYARVGSQPRVLAPTEAGTVLDRALDNLRQSIQESHAVIERDPMPTVLADASQLERLFQNLISNAIKFRDREPPRIHVGAVRRGRRWVFSVRDNGIGLDPAHQDRVFRVFQRLHPREQFSGTGIGLAVCKGIVERHGGRIWVESQPGAGSTFYFTLRDARERAAHDDGSGRGGQPPLEHPPSRGQSG